VAAILKACDTYPTQNSFGYDNRSRIRAFILLLLYTGLRIRDVACLPRSKVQKGLVTLYTQKTGTPVSIPLPEVALKSLDALPNEGVLTEKSVGIVGVEVELRWNYIPGAMRELIFALLYSLSCGLRTRTHMHLEIIALRHQLGVLQRKVPTRPKLDVTDRWLWVALSRFWSNWRSSLVIVKPGTVVAWHRQGFRLYWTWKSRQRIGRPKINTEVREIIQRISRANPLWGAPRIHGGPRPIPGYGREVHGTQPPSAVAVLADFSRQSRFAAGFDRLLHCANGLVRSSIRVCRSGT